MPESGALADAPSGEAAAEGLDFGTAAERGAEAAVPGFVPFFAGLSSGDTTASLRSKNPTSDALPAGDLAVFGSASVGAPAGAAVASRPSSKVS